MLDITDLMEPSRPRAQLVHSTPTAKLQPTATYPSAWRVETTWKQPKLPPPHRLPAVRRLKFWFKISVNVIVQWVADLVFAKWGGFNQYIILVNFTWKVYENEKIDRKGARIQDATDQEHNGLIIPLENTAMGNYYE